MTLQHILAFWSRIYFQIWICRLSNKQVYVRFLYASSAILSAYSILSAPRRSCRVALVVRTDASLSSYHSRCVLWGKHWISDASCREWPYALGVIHTASRATPSWAEQNRTNSVWKTNLRYEMEAFTLLAEPNWTEPDWALSLADVLLVIRL